MKRFCVIFFSLLYTLALICLSACEQTLPNSENNPASPPAQEEYKEPQPSAQEKDSPVDLEIIIDPALYEQVQTEEFSFRDTLTVQITNVLKTEKRILPAEDNFEYEVYTVLPGAEIKVQHAAVEDTVELGSLGIWKIYNKDGSQQFIEPGMPNIPITENTTGIGAESVCILVFELYTGE